MEPTRLIKACSMAAGALVFSLLGTVLQSSAGLAADAGDVQQLRDTGVCVQCDLSGADLRGLHALGADLRGADLSGANLSDANLEGADLTGANLSLAQLKRTMLTDSSLAAADLRFSDLTEAKLYHADLEGALVHNVILTQAETFGTKISVR